MPLRTSVKRDNELLTLNWGSFHVAAMVIATSIDSGRGPFEENTWKGICEEHDPEAPLALSPADCFNLVGYGPLSATPLGSEGSYTLKGSYAFLDVTDGEVFTLIAGDVLSAYRSF